VGLRRRGSRLSTSRIRRAPFALIVLPLLLAGCFGLSEEDQQRFTLHQTNSQEFYTKGSYRQAVQQAEMALTFDKESVGMRLMRGFCLTKLGESAGSVRVLDEAIRVLEDLAADTGGENYRVWLGLGQAHLARALLSESEIGRIQWQLGSDFLDENGRRAEALNLEEEREGYQHNLERCEYALRRVLEFEFQEDNPYALIELALVLNIQEGREREALDFSERAVRELIQSNKITNNTLQENLNLSPSFELSLKGRVDNNLEKERLLRSNIAHIYYDLGEDEPALEALNELERRQLMRGGDYEFRAVVHERLGMLDESVLDLETFLKLRAQVADYDELATEIFDRIDDLVARGAQAPAFK
jgi:tetratricopeptide (TPR) repeat protein